MIQILQDGQRTAIWLGVDGLDPAYFLGCGPTLEAALIDAEKALRTDLDDVQAQLTAERARLRLEIEK